MVAICEGMRRAAGRGILTAKIGRVYISFSAKYR